MFGASKKDRKEKLEFFCPRCSEHLIVSFNPKVALSTECGECGKKVSIESARTFTRPLGKGKSYENLLLRQHEEDMAENEYATRTLQRVASLSRARASQSERSDSRVTSMSEGSADLSF